MDGFLSRWNDDSSSPASVVSKLQKRIECKFRMFYQGNQIWKSLNKVTEILLITKLTDFIVTPNSPSDLRFSVLFAKLMQEIGSSGKRKFSPQMDQCFCFQVLLELNYNWYTAPKTCHLILNEIVKKMEIKWWHTKLTSEKHIVKHCNCLRCYFFTVRSHTSNNPLANGNNLCKTCRIESTSVKNGIQQHMNVSITTVLIFVSLIKLFGRK